MSKPVQYFNKEYLERCKGMTTDQILEFLENFKLLVAAQPEKCQMISLKIEPSLLQSFKAKAKLNGVPYQTEIKKIMKQWVLENNQ